jgi:spore coat polysaccharide biosynthesis predicted glycosyltransferase SpsG
MGHVMRCLSIAEAAYLKRGVKPVFIIADTSCHDMISDRGFESLVLGTDYRDMESELPKLSEFIRAGDVILADSYQATVDYYKQLSRLCRVACLEDMGVPYPVDILINYNIYGPALGDKYKNTQNEPKKTLLGVKYMPLRESFRSELSYDLKDKVTDVMVTTGGSDPLYAAGAIMDRILRGSFFENSDIKFHVVSGPFNKYASRLKSEYGGLENVTIHENVKDMKGLMKACDVVITATGSTIYEVSALGVPMICFYFADNQKQGAEELAKLTDIVNAGCFAKDKSGTADNIYNALVRCTEDYEYRKTLHNQEKRLVDGNGALRIVNEIL